MLSPDLSTTRTSLATTFDQMHQILGYAKKTNTLKVGFLKPDPSWLASVRSRVSLLSDAGNNMVIDYPDIWSPILVGFKNYTTLFASLKSYYDNDAMDRKKWIVLFKAARDLISENVRSSHSAIELLDKRQDDFQNVQPLLDASIKEGWQALTNEEQQIIKIVTALTKLQDELTSLQSKLDSDVLAGGKDAVQTSVTIIYDLLEAAEMSIPFLSAASLAFTIGKTFYDIISETAEINDLIGKIGQLQIEASDEAQALAATKMVLQTLYNLELNFKALRDDLPSIHQMWVGELGKIDAVIEALEAGADPKTYMEILSIPMANATWQSINELVTQLRDYQFTQGPPVNIHITKHHS